MPVDRLSPLDEAFLRIESDEAPMHVGWTLLIDGQPPAISALRRHVAGRLGRLPRFRRRVLGSRSRLHDPVWVDDADFDIDHHVREVLLAPPGGPTELRALVGKLLSMPLDGDRPLWRLQLVRGLRDGGFAIVGQAHHALVDGIAALEVAQLLLDAVPEPLEARPLEWSPAAVPPLRTRALGSLAERAKLGRSAVSGAARTFVNPGIVGDSLAALRQISSALSPLARPAPRTALNRSIGPARSVAFAELSLAAVREVGQTRGASVNDVVLATSALTLGRYLRRHGESHPWLRTLVPVSTRPEGTAGELGNRVAFVLVELPIGERSPSAALEEVMRQMRAHKRRNSAGALDGLLRAARFTPLAIRDALAWVATRPQTFNTVVSNVPGPPEPLYMLGRRVQAAYPAVPLPSGHGLSIGILSYHGVLHVGFYADPAIVSDVVAVAQDFSSAFDALRFALGPRDPDATDPGRPPKARPGAPIPIRGAGPRVLA